MSATLWAPQAWIGNEWAQHVTLRIGAHGRWTEVRRNTTCPEGAEVVPGAVVPGVVNAHSHAFQRAFVGMSERRESERDDFWSWRDRMYDVALRITPEQLEAVAAHLYAELLAGGFTHTCEFHYLHHAPDGEPWSNSGADDAAMSRALANAARRVGMGLTILPVLYERAGFTQPVLREDQRRFAADAARVLALRDTIRSWKIPRVDAGIAIHSLRAARPESIRTLLQLAGDDPAPIHLHISEQMAEVDECLTVHGARPIEWLAREFALDARWQLVHATHARASEIAAVAVCGAGLVLCPGTEANLGDGLCDLPRWLRTDAPISIGTDSHVVRSWPEELRLLEYGQRLAMRQRNVAAAPATQPSTAARLFDRVLAGGAVAAGRSAWGFQVGARADLVLLNSEDPALAGLPSDMLLDGVVFGTPAQPFARTMVAGKWTPRRNTRPPFVAAMEALWGNGGTTLTLVP